MIRKGELFLITVISLDGNLRVNKILDSSQVLSLLKRKTWEKIIYNKICAEDFTKGNQIEQIL